MSDLFVFLDADPVNCGNCKLMKTRHEKFKGRSRLVSYCKENIISMTSRGWILDRKFDYLPSAWQKAKTCPHFPENDNRKLEEVSENDIVTNKKERR